MKSLLWCVLARAALLLAALAAWGPAVAASEAKNCPAEPTQNVAIASGTVFSGSNCVISPGVDLDSFRFNAKSGETWLLTVAMDGGAYPNDICLELYEPGLPAKLVFSGCSYSYGGVVAVTTYQTLATDGQYTMVVTEAGGDAVIKYGVSLERKYPAPPDGRAIGLGESVVDDLELADVDAYTFAGTTSGTYRVTSSISSGGYPANLCLQVWAADGSNLGADCTYTYGGVVSVAIDVTPPVDGKITAFLYEASGARALGYGLNVQCLSGDCPEPYPPCTLKDTATYDPATETLTMKFTVGHQYTETVTWNGWLTYQNTMERLFRRVQPLTNPPVVVTRTRTGLPKSGKIGVLSTLTTPTKGIICQSWVQVGTGKP